MSLLIVPPSPQHLFLVRYTTGKSPAGLKFHEAHPEVAHVRTIFHEWLRTVYSRFFHRLCRPFADLVLNILLGDEEKKKRTLQGSLSFLSMAAPHLADADDSTSHLADMDNTTSRLADTESPTSHLADADGPASHITNTVGDASPSNICPSPMNPSHSSLAGVGGLQSPNFPTSLPPTQAMDTTGDTSPSDGSGLHSSFHSPMSVSVPEGLISPATSPFDSPAAPLFDSSTRFLFDSPAVPPAYEGVVQNPSDNTNSRGTSETRAPSPLPAEPSPGPPSGLSSPRDTPPPCSNASTPSTTTTTACSPLTSAGDGTLSLTGILGDFISQDTLAYWETVPGGGKWVAMVKNYLMLQTMPTSKDVCTVLHPILFNTLILCNLCLATSATFSSVSTKRVADLVESWEAFPRSGSYRHQRLRLW